MDYLHLSIKISEGAHACCAPISVHSRIASVDRIVTEPFTLLHVHRSFHPQNMLLLQAIMGDRVSTSLKCSMRDQTVPSGSWGLVAYQVGHRNSKCLADHFPTLYS